ncbi:sodium-dependent phosphate transport protein 2B-like [Branchiostoma floridae]|uniref:Sodium-dependent phosphate transport protein 2B-like n=1 Tax=Branchiostoma floridae TaxID=7739 RepID=A0A9J7N1K3_BRAFL|nr:sodium-dependent phosphate transport protein 2B-like [Branchiostoma floridae]XP_035689342.1 sodium-dependent phosphate transport protein 2B-like [Branchiostoma floridae]XP_035689344.1 sodium-dependent phosphate transport protein 2B-like [Branchiostoma floridae]XP_035689345.1 sodium-dependent phosphate transport protein 2B-like [Branchiostoma floridae]
MYRTDPAPPVAVPMPGPAPGHIKVSESQADLVRNMETQPAKGAQQEEYDPWHVARLKDEGTKWGELDSKGKALRVVGYIMKPLLLLGLIYLFICSLDFLSSAFRLLGGRAAGETLSNNELLTNPVAGLMIGVLATVLVQSSSTSTSIVVTMVGASILEVKPAIPIIMGANIGTSVTNTIVSLAHSGDKDEFRRAFAGATIHDMFNWLSVIVLLPLEVISGYLFHLSAAIIDSYNIQTNKDAEQEILKVITKPFTSLVIQIDKKVITKTAQGLNETGSLLKEGDYLFANTGLSESELGVVILILALIILCVCLVLIVKLLHSMLRGRVAYWTKKIINAEFPGKAAFLSGYLAIAAGAGMTFIVQSSSIFTSALTPLVAVGVLHLERCYPLTLGANIGTTATAILASLTNDGQDLKNSLQLALCHFFFNISGIVLWYPIPSLVESCKPSMSKWFPHPPIVLAKWLGNKTAKYRWFALVYLFLMFFILPALVFGLSFAGWQVLVGVGVPILLIFIVICIINVMQVQFPRFLPAKLRNWNFLPSPLHSLKPYDAVCVLCCKAVQRSPCGRYCRCKCCRQMTDEPPVEQVNVNTYL